MNAGLLNVSFFRTDVTRQTYACCGEVGGLCTKCQRPVFIWKLNIMPLNVYRLQQSMYEDVCDHEPAHVEEVGGHCLQDSS